MKKKSKNPQPDVVKHKVMRELYRNYMQFREYVRSTGETTIEYRDVAISFFDLGMGLNELSPRKKQAFYLNVILDKKQKDVAEIMGITTVSVGQYVEAASRQLAEIYFGESDE
jgi:predicted transcriptional regulator